MKKSAFLLAIFYLLNAVGYGFEVHYCLGQIADINYAFLDTSCVCDETHSEVKRSSCCDDESFFIQIDDAHQAAASSIVLDQPQAAQELCFTDIHNHAVQEIEISDNSLRAPPKPIERTILYHTFIFYA